MPCKRKGGWSDNDAEAYGLSGRIDSKNQQYELLIYATEFDCKIHCK
jgi:hypothetical protein